jgi:hypothetical protein
VRKGDQVVRWGPAIDGNGVNVETLSEAEIHARLEIWKEVQEMRSKPGMGSLFLAQTAAGIGVRETRRILGEYTVTEQDAIEGEHLSDVVAIGSNPFPDYHGRRYFLPHEGFDIPYRALVPLRRLCRWLSHITLRWNLCLLRGGSPRSNKEPLPGLGVDALSRQKYSPTARAIDQYRQCVAG